MKVINPELILKELEEELSIKPNVEAEFIAYLVVGLPGTSKNVLSNGQLKKYLEKQGRKVKVLSKNDTMLRYAKLKYKTDSYSEAYKKLDAEDYKSINIIFQQELNQAYAEGCNIIIHMSLLTKDVRNALIDRIKLSYKIRIVGTAITYKDLLESNSFSKDPIDEKLLQKMFLTYEFPRLGDHGRIEDVKIITDFI